MSVTVRPAEAGDAAAIASCLSSLGYDNTTAEVGGKLAALAESSSDAVIVAVERSAGVVGVISVHVLPLFHAPGNLARITALVVLEGHRGRGAGSALVAEAERFAWQQDCRRVEVTSGDHRMEAHAFYERRGYALDERRFIKHRSAAV